GRVGDGAQFDLRVRYSWESPILGSAGGPRRALPLLPDEDIFIINGDSLTDVDLRSLAEAHRTSGALVTMAVVENRWPGRYGGVVTDSRGIVKGFVPRTSPATSYHFIGVQLVHPSVFGRLPKDEPAESVGQVYPLLIAERPGSVRGFLTRSSFVDVGTLSDYFDASLSLAQRYGFDAPPPGERTRIDPTARLLETVVWDDVEIGAGAILRRCIVADRVRIPTGARFENCAIIEQDGELKTTSITHG